MSYSYGFVYYVGCQTRPARLHPREVQGGSGRLLDDARPQDLFRFATFLSERHGG
jgi:hypothetical protein